MRLARLEQHIRRAVHSLEPKPSNCKGRRHRSASIFGFDLDCPSTRWKSIESSNLPAQGGSSRPLSSASKRLRLQGSAVTRASSGDVTPWVATSVSYSHHPHIRNTTIFGSAEACTVATLKRSAAWGDHQGTGDRRIGGMAGAEMGELEVTEVEGTVTQVPVPLSTLDARAAVLEDPGLQLLGEIFRKNGHELRLAGGVVRDVLMGLEPHDIDLCTTATPEEMAGEEGLKGGFLRADAGVEKVIPTGLVHGTVTAVINHEPYEITTLRIDTDHDGRHCEVQFTTEWTLDAERRDLTVNAMMMGLDGRLYDYFNGWRDLVDRRVQFVGEPRLRLEEDYLRILRYFRFHGRINGADEHTEACAHAITQGAPGLRNISGERIRAEMVKILAHTKSVVSEVQAMIRFGVFANIAMPEVSEEQMEELVRVVELSSDSMTRLATMLATVEEVETINECWKLTKRELAYLRFLMEHREAGHDLVWAKAHCVRSAASAVITKGEVAEVLRYGGRTAEANTLDAWDVPKCPVNGGDLIKAGHKKGPALGAVLSELRERWIESDYTLTREQLLPELA
eukprot:m.449859 g.449859  ORF g.449859 m.449859 type:complete len:567 (-) comp19884_c0_seq1:114-1814(-)